jgi:CheY-like chemotaxis protein
VKFLKEISREDFLDFLHDALNHLYNADYLRKSPLADLFGLSGRFDTSTALRKILVEAIDSFKPPSSEQDQSKTWRTYESLYCCFIQQLNQQIVADQLSISPRQLRREQHNAIEHLADYLWQKYKLSTPPQAVKLPVLEDEKNSQLLGELGWMVETQPVAPNHLRNEVQAALGIIQPLAQKMGVLMENCVQEDIPTLAVHAVALNQILVSLFNAAVHAAAQGRVSVSAKQYAVEVGVVISVSEGSGNPGEPLDVDTDLEIAGDLARLSGGRITVTASEKGPFPIRLVLPALERFPVLVIDDNADSLQLLERYASGTRYHVVSTRETAQLLELIDKIHPRIIVLDIMMPQENGWIVLGRLRQHPASRDIPIIVHTILPQESLALSLGANAFLKKPVSREVFLHALDQQCALQEQEYL